MSELERIIDEVDFQLSIVEQTESALRDRRRSRQRQVSMRNGVDTGEECKVQQQFKSECDVNTIVERFGIANELPVVNSGGLYGDFTAITEMEDVRELHARVQSQFAALPPELREQFNNDPMTLAQFAASVGPEDFDEFLSDYVSTVTPESASVAPAASETAGEPVKPTEEASK